MTGAADEFESLFDEISAQRNEKIAAASAPASAPDETETPVESVAEDQSDKPIFDRLGGIVRLLHDSLRELGYGQSLSNVAVQITDAKGRLEYIAELTEQAANKVLNAIDVSMPAQDALVKHAQDVNNRWALLFEGKLGVEEFKTLATDTKQFSASVAESAEAEKARMLEIMMAQDFQDITGQLIKKLVALTHDAERELTKLLHDNAPAELKAALAAADSKAESLMNGPSMSTTPMAQDGVDDLLASLGF